MKVQIALNENKRSIASYNGFSVYCDAPLDKQGRGEYPEPFDYFVMSVGMCAGHYVREFCLARNIQYTDINIGIEYQRIQEKPVFDIFLTLPHDFPEKYHKALLLAVNSCSIKKAIMDIPNFNVQISH